MTGLHRGYDFSQHVDMAHKPIVAVALQQIDGEKIRTTGTPGTAIVGNLVVALPLIYTVQWPEATRRPAVIAPYADCRTTAKP